MSDVLDLDATPPPGAPRYRSSVMIGCRVTPSTKAWLDDRAVAEHTTVAALLQRLIEREQRAERLPVDVRDWLARQAAQCGCPGDIDQALIAVVRHLAARWPNGGRLRS